MPSFIQLIPTSLALLSSATTAATTSTKPTKPTTTELYSNQSLQRTALQNALSPHPQPSTHSPHTQHSSHSQPSKFSSIQEQRSFYYFHSGIEMATRNSMILAGFDPEEVEDVDLYLEVLERGLEKELVRVQMELDGMAGVAVVDGMVDEEDEEMERWIEEVEEIEVESEVGLQEVTNSVPFDNREEGSGSTSDFGDEGGIEQSMEETEQFDIAIDYEKGTNDSVPLLEGNNLNNDKENSAVDGNDEPPAKENIIEDEMEQWIEEVEEIEIDHGDARESGDSMTLESADSKKAVGGEDNEGSEGSESISIDDSNSEESLQRADGLEDGFDRNETLEDDEPDLEFEFDEIEGERGAAIANVTNKHLEKDPPGNEPETNENTETKKNTETTEENNAEQRNEPDYSMYQQKLDYSDMEQEGFQPPDGADFITEEEDDDEHPAKSRINQVFTKEYHHFQCDLYSERGVQRPDKKWDLILSHFWKFAGIPRADKIKYKRNPNVRPSKQGEGLIANRNFDEGEVVLSLKENTVMFHDVSEWNDFLHALPTAEDACWVMEWSYTDKLFRPGRWLILLTLDESIFMRKGVSYSRSANVRYKEEDGLVYLAARSIKKGEEIFY